MREFWQAFSVTYMSSLHDTEVYPAARRLAQQMAADPLLAAFVRAFDDLSLNASDAKTADMVLAFAERNNL